MGDFIRFAEQQVLASVEYIHNENLLMANFLVRKLAEPPLSTLTAAPSMVEYIHTENLL